MAFMQFEFDLLPATVGCGIYVAYRLLFATLAARPQKVSKSVEQDLEFQQKPAAEPEAEEPRVVCCPPPGHAPTSSSWLRPLLWRSLVVGLVLLLPELPGFLDSSGGRSVVWPPAQAPVCSGSGHSAAACSKPGSRLHGPELPPEGPVYDAPLTVKLTRQAMDFDEDYVRSAYYGTVMIGSPPLEMTVVFDTGSGHLVLPSMYCNSETCKAHARYRRSSSTTGRDIHTDGRTVTPGSPRDSLTIAFGTGQVSGVLVEDEVCIGGLNSSSVGDLVALGAPADLGCVRMRFLAATALSEDPFKAFNFDGILGLGLEGLSQTREFNFIEVMADSLRDLERARPNTFGVFLATTHREDSEIALGGWTKARTVEELSWGPVHNPELGHWIVPIRGIRVDTDRLDFCDDGRCLAAVDTGTSLLAVPSATFRELYESLRHPTPLAGHCHGPGPLLHFELDNYTITLGPREYAQVRNTSQHAQMPRLENSTGISSDAHYRYDLRCVPMLMTLDLPAPLGPKLFILGEPVLRKYYTVYDSLRKRVGFGRARHLVAPSRDDILTRAVELDAAMRIPAASRGRRQRRRPTMFDAFRWRRALGR
mmetsp:Transcript_2237/g.6355  ORF Transcript_2237/g.6355 Transcript_2237/m.6355 type:complete len:592 (-) Transcript_2237:177-1952(-)